MSPNKEVFAILRSSEGQAEVTVVKVLADLDEAVSEVKRLNEFNAASGHKYFWQATRYFEGKEK